MNSSNGRLSLLDIQAFANQIYGGRPLVIVPYAYELTFSGITANATQSQTLSITANADFILTEIKGRTADTTLQTVSNKNAPYFKVLITDSGSNEQFTNTAVDVENYVTNGGSDAGILPYPRFIAGRTALSVVLSEFAGVAATQTFNLMLQGVLVRTYSG